MRRDIPLENKNSNTTKLGGKFVVFVETSQSVVTLI